MSLRARLPEGFVSVIYRRRLVRCGKPDCARCTSSAAGGHGPYWYAYWNDPETGRRRTMYLGKHFSPPIRLTPHVFGDVRLPPKP